MWTNVNILLFLEDWTRVALGWTKNTPPRAQIMLIHIQIQTLTHKLYLPSLISCNTTSYQTVSTFNSKYFNLLLISFNMLLCSHEAFVQANSEAVIHKFAVSPVEQNESLSGCAESPQIVFLIFFLINLLVRTVRINKHYCTCLG